jgi:hypothetical protein
MLPQWRVNQQARLTADGVALSSVPAATEAAAQ